MDRLALVSLLADVSTLTAELLVFGIPLWLLFRVTQAAADFDPAPPLATAPA
jgi:hypothetical protein